MSDKIVDQLADQLDSKLKKVFDDSDTSESDTSDSDEDVDVIINVVKREQKLRKPEPAYKEKMKTAPCESVGTANPCRHGSKCCFAHYKFEFRPQECRFGEDCRAVERYAEHAYDNSRNCRKKCVFIHPYESLNSACDRLGIPDEPKEEPEKKELKTVERPKKTESVPTKVPQKMLTLNVSRKEAIEEIQKLLTCGFTHFEVNIIDQ